MASQTDVQDEQESHPRQAESEKHDRYQSSDLEAVGDHARVVDPEIEARVVRKIDLFLMPAMVIGKSVAHQLINKKYTDTLIQAMEWYTMTR